MKFSVKETGNCQIVEIKGELVFSEYKAFRGVLVLMERLEGKRAAIDLSGVVNMDSAGAGMLLLAADYARKEGVDLQFINAAEELSHMVGAIELITDRDSISENIEDEDADTFVSPSLAYAMTP